MMIRIHQLAVGASDAAIWATAAMDGCIKMYMHTNISTYSCIYTYPLIYIYTYIHMCICRDMHEVETCMIRSQSPHHFLPPLLWNSAHLATQRTQSAHTHTHLHTHTHTHMYTRTQYTYISSHSLHQILPPLLWMARTLPPDVPILLPHTGACSATYEWSMSFTRILWMSGVCHSHVF